MELENYIIVCVGMYIVMWLIARWLKQRVAESEAEVAAVVKLINSKIHPVLKEVHGDHIYWFDAETDEFLAQGATQEEIVSVLKERFRGHIFLISPTEMLAGPNLEVYPLDPDIINITSKSMVSGHIN